MTEHRAEIEPTADGVRGACPCGWLGQDRVGAELAIHDAEEHLRYQRDVAALTAGGDGEE